MSALLLALIAFTCALAPQRQVSVSWSSRLDYHGADAFGVTTCDHGQPSIALTRGATVDEQAHEWAHAAACVVDGTFAAGPSALDPTHCALDPGDCAHAWVYFALRNPETVVRELMALGEGH